MHQRPKTRLFTDWSNPVIIHPFRLDQARTVTAPVAFLQAILARISGGVGLVRDRALDDLSRL